MPHKLMSPRSIPCGVYVFSSICPVSMNLTVGTNFANVKNVSIYKTLNIINPNIFVLRFKIKRIVWQSR